MRRFGGRWSPGGPGPEGPVWVADAQGGHLLVSDVPANTVFRRKEKEGISVFLEPSGFTGPVGLGGQGFNGVTLDAKGRLFFDGTRLLATREGVPDGLKVAKDGTVFATGPVACS